MNDVKEINTVAWQRLVGELTSPAPDDQAFLDRLLRLVGQASAARQAVVFVPVAGERGEMVVRPLAAWPTPGAPQQGAGVESLIQNWDQASRAAYACIESGQTRVFTLRAGEGMYEPGAPTGDGFIIAIALPGTGGPETGAGGQKTPGAITLVVESRSKGAVQSTIAMCESLVGYIHLHATRTELRRAAASAMALETATNLLGAINSADGFNGAAMGLVNDVARVFSAERVALGWVKGQSVRLAAMSDTEHFDRRTAIARKLESAMDECLDQEQAVLFPAPPTSADVVLGQAIVHSHRELAGGDERLRVCSCPLRVGDEVVGVLTLEARVGTGQGIDPTIVDRLQACLDLLAPVLAVRHRDDQPLYKRTAMSFRESARWLVGPRHTIWKVVALIVLAALIACATVHVTHHVNATAEIRPVERRIIAMPFDGVILKISENAEAGRTVLAGETLIELDASELHLQLADAVARQVQHERALSQARKENRTGEAMRAQAQMDAAKAQADLYRSRIERSRIVAPISGTVISGHLKERIGASIRVGDELLQVAPLEKMIAVAKLDESDLLLDDDGKARVRPGVKGEIATRSNPGRGFGVTVLRVVPLAQAQEGKNTFEVWVTIDEQAAWMRPGMEGIVRLESGDRSLLWIGTRRIVDTIRLWLW